MVRVERVVIRLMQLEECIYERRPNCQCVKDLGTSRTCEDI